MEIEEEVGEHSILRPLWRELREIGRRRNGQVLQVMEEEGETFLFLPPQYNNHNKKLHPLLLHLKTVFSWIGVV